MANYKGISRQTIPHIKNTTRNYTANLILEKARGRWPYILESLDICASYLKDKHGPCPVCGGKDRFRFDNKDGLGTFYCNRCGAGAGAGIKLLQLHRGCNFTEAVNMVAYLLGEQPPERHRSEGPKHISAILKNVVQVSRYPQKLSQRDIEKRRKSLNKVWMQSKPVMVGDPVDCYLRGRGIALSSFPTVLRLHPQLPYYDNGVFVGTFPAMLALVQDKNNQGVTLHRTYLGDGCKADVQESKKLMSAIMPRASMGAAIKLYEPIDGQIVLAEGIENALSVYIATNLPAWATASACALEKVILPQSITEIIIAIDNDESNRGQEAAAILSARLLKEGRIVKRAIPPKVGQDFNDLLLEGNI